MIEMGIAIWTDPFNKQLLNYSLSIALIVDDSNQLTLHITNRIQNVLNEFYRSVQFSYFKKKKKT